MMDMYRKPEELKRLCHILAKVTLRSIDTGKSIYESDDSEGVPKICFIPLHRGANGFMNNKQFEEFYWPSLTLMMEGMIERGIVPCPFFEGGYSDRLGYLADFAKKHKGKMVYWFHDIYLSLQPTCRYSISFVMCIGNIMLVIYDFDTQTWNSLTCTLYAYLFSKIPGIRS